MARVLVVDDNKLVRVLLAQVMKEAGHETYEAENGAEAFAAIKAHPPDLVVTDFYMPETDGAEFVKMIRAEHGFLRLLPIVGLAGTADSERRLIDAGVNAYLPKPVREKAIREAVEKALAESTEYQELLALHKK